MNYSNHKKLLEMAVTLIKIHLECEQKTNALSFEFEKLAKLPQVKVKDNESEVFLFSDTIHKVVEAIPFISCHPTIDDGELVIVIY